MKYWIFILFLCLVACKPDMSLETFETLYDDSVTGTFVYNNITVIQEDDQFAVVGDESHYYYNKTFISCSQQCTLSDSFIPFTQIKQQRMSVTYIADAAVGERDCAVFNVTGTKTFQVCLDYELGFVAFFKNETHQYTLQSYSSNTHITLPVRSELAAFGCENNTLYVIPTSFGVNPVVRVNTQELEVPLSFGERALVSFPASNGSVCVDEFCDSFSCTVDDPCILDSFNKDTCTCFFDHGLCLSS